MHCYSCITGSRTDMSFYCSLGMKMGVYKNAHNRFSFHNSSSLNITKHIMHCVKARGFIVHKYSRFQCAYTKNLLAVCCMP